MAKNAFTLIELLIVIAIIAILAGIIVATLGNPTAEARDSTRMNDLDALGDAAQQYQMDLGAFPPSIDAMVASGHLSAEPLDPDTGADYNYAHCTVGTKPRAAFGATLEATGNIGAGNKADEDTGDITCTAAPTVCLPAGFCTVAVIECDDANDAMYCVAR